MHQPTQQQEEILKAFQEGHSFQIVALAGTGKTSTLELLVKARRGRNTSSNKGLYIAYNKRIADEARRKLQGIEIKTMHALAYRWAEGIFSKDRLTVAPSLYLLRRHLDKFSRESDELCLTALKTVQRFTWSSDPRPNLNHLPSSEEFTWLKSADKSDRRHVVTMARKIWAKSSNPSGHDYFPLGHDGYLKLWQLSNPTLSELNYCLVDEAQDLNPVMVSILKLIKPQLVMVGDHFQQIYQWRGAKNALAGKSWLPQLPLSYTFRFGDSIANLANILLHHLGSQFYLETTQDDHGRILSAPECNDLQNVQIDAYVARKNTSILSQAKRYFDANIAFEIVDPTGRIKDLIADYDSLSRNPKRYTAKTSLFVGFENWDQVVKFSDSLSVNNELSQIVALFNNHSPSDLRNVIRASGLGNYPIQLTTVHQAKGLEWNSVVLSDDFSVKEGVAQEEVRLLYVAITRARSVILIPKAVEEYVHHLINEHALNG